MRLRAASRVLAVSVALSVGVGAAALGAPAGAAARAAPGALAKVTVSTNTSAKPTVKVATPFTIRTTTDSTVAKGPGAALAAGETVTFDYVLVDGRTGKEVQTSYGKSPASLVLDPQKTNKRLVTALTGETVGSRVLVAIAPKDGLAKRITAPGVKKDDALVFVVDVKGVRTPLTRATGDAVTPPDGLPTVALAADGKPTVTIPSGVPAPKSLVVQPLIKGTGPVVQAGQTISVNDVGVIYGTGKQFDSSWDRGQPADVVIGKNQVIPGWDEGLVGQTVGSQVLLVIPPDQGYGSQGDAGAGIKGTDTIVFVVDILDAY